MKRENFEIPAELTSVTEALSENRPTLTALELDQVKQRARAQANRKTDIYGWKGIRIMRPRLVATALLVTGMFFTGSGATLAVISDSNSAAVVQYPNSTPPPTDTGTTQTPSGNEVLGENFSGGNTPAATPTQGQAAPAKGGNEVLGAKAKGGTLPKAAAKAPAAVQANRQLGTSGNGGSLPFTGFAAIPILLIGLLMLGSGVALRRAMRRTTA